MKRSSQFPSTSEKMKRKIKSAFMKFINTTLESHHQKDKITINHEIDEGTIQCLEEGIQIMVFFPISLKYT